jgi:prepilin-type N-terminal cleavage/methylation domain-containing protein
MVAAAAKPSPIPSATSNRWAAPAINAEPRCRPLSRRAARGFTLLELALVLAMIVALASIAIPSFRGSMGRQRLRKAAEALRVQCVRTRQRAMNTATTHSLMIAPGSGTFLSVWYAPNLDELNQSQQLTAAAEAESIAALQGGQEVPEGLGRSLPEGVTFREVSATEAPALSASGTALPVDVAASQSILFYPDGSTSTAQVTLAGDENQTITVFLRGLTGGVRVGPIQREGSAP